jgi:protein O-GlcNAc transferase
MTIAQAFELALQRHRAGQLADADALYRQILAAQPNHADAMHLRGVIAYQGGQGDAAVDLIRQAVGLNANNAFAHSNLGEAYRKVGRLDEAICSYRRALELNADFPEACNNLGIALRDRGHLDEAVAACRRAIELAPEYPEAHYNLGIALREQGRLEEAIAAYRRALRINPDFPEAQDNLANALRDGGFLDEAIAAYRRALQLQPNDPETHTNLGIALRDCGQFDEAIAACLRALEIKPDLPDAHTNLGNALRDRGQLDEAIAAYRRALQIKPDFSDACNNLANALNDIGRIDEAIEFYRRALEIRPGNSEAHSNLIYSLLFHPRHDAGTIAEERKRWNRQFSDPVKQLIMAHTNDRELGRRLRIGYVSPDFREQVIGRNILPLFECHDRQNFEILCYSGVVRPDPLTDKFRERADQWRSTVGVGDAALAEMIRQDGVDILVDLTQHMAGNRLPVFARKPAPIQVSFAGYPESTGLEAIEYRISDRYLERGCVDEGIGGNERVRLIDSFWCYAPREVGVKVNEPPARETGRVTFGSLNNFCKVNEQTLKLWARVLGAVGDSRLVLLSRMGSPRRRTLDVLERHGVARGRVEFVDFHPRREYLELYHRLDIVLDTFPYNGHTTSLDALWMGVPVVSLAGDTPVSRAGLSQLTNLGLPELAAHSETEYVNIACDLARDVPRLAQLRSTLRDRMENSILMDAPRFARQVEQAYREMWQTWRPGQSSIGEGV